MMNILINLKTYPLNQIENLIKNYHTSNLSYIYNDEDSLEYILNLYKKIKKKDCINIICDDSSINTFLYNNPNYEIVHYVTLYPKNHEVCKNIIIALKNTNSKFLIINNVFNLSTDYQSLIDYLTDNDKPIYYVYGVDEISIENYKKLTIFSKEKNIPLKSPTNMYTYQDTYEAIFDDKNMFKNINTSNITILPTQIYPLSNDKYTITQTSDSNYQEYVNNKEKYQKIYNELYQLYLKNRLHGIII